MPEHIHTQTARTLKFVLPVLAPGRPLFFISQFIDEPARIGAKRLIFSARVPVNRSRSSRASSSLIDTRGDAEREGSGSEFKADLLDIDRSIKFPGDMDTHGETERERRFPREHGGAGQTQRAVAACK